MFVYELSGCGFESSCSHLNKTVVWKKGNIKLDEALRLAKINPESFHSMIWRCASKLRNDIFAVQSKQTCEPVTVDNITGRETISPDSVKSFFKMLCTGNLSTTEEYSSEKFRVIDSSAADAVFCCSVSKLIPGKQLSLGFALKFMTGSKKVLILRNRYGHFVQAVKQCDELMFLLSRLLTTLIASYQMVLKQSRIYQQEQLGITSI